MNVYAIPFQTIRMMDEEEREDTSMRDRFKEKWTRTPSRKLTEQLRVEAGKYKSILDNAVKADAIVKSKYNENRRALDILCKSEVLTISFISSPPILSDYTLNYPY